MNKFTFRKGGIHPPQDKLTAEKGIVDMPLPSKVVLSLSQSIGVPAVTSLKKGDKVRRGDMVGQPGGFVSAPVHTPISGTVVSVGTVTSPTGMISNGIVIEADENDHRADLQMIGDMTFVRSEAEALALSKEQLIDIIGNAGIVGLGGATFPTKVKLLPPEGMKADILIVNAAECEPYLTCDEAIMLEQPREIVEGVRYLMKAAAVDKAVIAIEDNKPRAIETMTQAVHSFDNITVATCRTKYPQGSEKQLIKAVTGREVASGALPVSVGAIVDNVATVLAVYHAVRWGLPLIERVVTVTGPSVSNPGNYRVPVGTTLSTLADMAGGIPDDTGKIIIGGPMMGKAAITLDSPATKGVSGILFLPESQSHRRVPTPCVRCAKCVDACPMGLEPYLISILSAQSRFDEADSNHVADCIECGSCMYTCPSARPLLDNIRVGKSTVLARRRAKK